MNAIISPSVLRNNFIPYNNIVQRAGEFMITFEGSYHAGFNYGFNCAEATNFATPSSVPYGNKATRCICYPSTVSIDMKQFYANWKKEGFPFYKI